MPNDRTPLVALGSCSVLLALVVAPVLLVTGPAGARPGAGSTATATETPTESLTGSPTGAPTETSTQTPTETASATPTGTPTGKPGAVELDDAVLRWGVNNESSNRAFAPGTFNFFSAGLIPDPGRGGTTLPRSRWRQQRGHVAVEKWDGTRWRPATWEGLGTTSDGEPLGSPTAGTFSNHTFVFRGGTGTVDRTAGTATVAWDGDVTVLYYSGMSFFHVSDPVLEVADGAGTLTATVRGYASSVEDLEEWAPVPAREVVLATLPEVGLGQRGFSAHPAYLGVRVTGVPQVTDGEHAGAFPQSFVDYMAQLGTAAFWYSSGAATDPYKVPLPLAVSYDASHSVAEPPPTPAPTQTPLAQPTPTPLPAPSPASGGPPPPLAPPDPPSAPAVPVAAPAVAPRPATQLATVAATPPTAAPGTGAHQAWWTGGALLLAAACLLLVPARPSPS